MEQAGSEHEGRQSLISSVTNRACRQRFSEHNLVMRDIRLSWKEQATDPFGSNKKALEWLLLGIQGFTGGQDCGCEAQHLRGAALAAISRNDLSSQIYQIWNLGNNSRGLNSGYSILVPK